MSDPATPVTDAAPAADIAPTTPTAAPVVGDAKPIDAPAADVSADPAKTTEPAKDGDKSPLGEKSADVEAPAEPIKYDFKVPEGMTLDEKQIATFTELGNELKLAPEAAQKLFDYHAGALKSFAEATQKATNEAAQAAYDNLIGGWKKELSTDPELSGAKADEAKVILGKVLDQFGSKEAREAFDLTGAGWNPHIIRMMVKMGRSLTEGGPTSIGNPKIGGGPKTPGAIFYPQKES